MPLDNGEIIHYNTRVNGVWRSLVSRLVRVQEASGSNPDTPTIEKSLETQLFHPIGTQCVIGVQLVRAKARRKLMHLSLRLAFLHKDRA